MDNRQALEREAAEDLFFGQQVIIIARWFLIGGAAVQVVWNVASPDALALAMVPVAVLMGMNFFVHGRYLIERPVNLMLLVVMSFLDIALVTALVVTWPVGPPGLESPFFAFYYPLLLAMGFVAPRRMTVAYAAAALALYGAVCLILNPDLLSSTADEKVLLLRLVTMAATAGIAHTYWRVHRERRRDRTGRSPAPAATP